MLLVARSEPELPERAAELRLVDLAVAAGVDLAEKVNDAERRSALAASTMHSSR